MTQLRQPSAPASRVLRVSAMLLVTGASLACQVMTPSTASPVTRKPPTPTLMPVCTPPPCGPNEEYYCPGECPGGCGTICVTREPSAQTEPVTPDPPTPTAFHPTVTPIHATITAVPPTITATPVVCDYAARGWFEGALKTVPGIQEKIGCPTAEQRAFTSASQDFQHGYMLWAEDEGMIYVFYDGGGWENYPDRWEEGMAEQDPSFGPPPEGLIQPKRGFGLVWQEHPAVRERLGWAFNDERACDKSNRQPFERGFMLECTQDTGPWAKIRVFVLFDDHTYTIYSPA